MSRRVRIVATAKPSADETYQVSVTATSAYPDALDEARRQATRGVSELIADAIKQYGRPLEADDDEAEREAALRELAPDTYTAEDF